MSNMKRVLETIEFYTREADEIHRLMDVVQVPREIDGSPLAMSQRVNYFLRFLMKAGVLVQPGAGSAERKVH